MIDVSTSFLETHRGELVSKANTGSERVEVRIAEDGSELGLSDEDERDAVAGIGVEVCHRLDSEQRFRGGVLGIVEYDDRFSSGLGDGGEEKRFRLQDRVWRVHLHASEDELEQLRCVVQVAAKIDELVADV